MLHTRICDLLGIDHPIISAPMSGTSGAELAAAVSAAGGFGFVGGTTRGGPNPEWLREQIRMVRERTDHPFGVGFISSFPGLDEMVKVAIQERVPVICHSFADPTPYIAPAHDAGVKVVVQVQTVAQAVTAACAGADAIAAQGTEAGGHTGYSGTLALVPAVVDAVGGVPVLAAGGIADGRGLAAALMLGAEGVWMGTRFIASEEAFGPAWTKERVVQAGTDDTVLTRVYDLALGLPFPAGIGDRVVRNAFVDAWHGREDSLVSRRVELATEVVRAMETGDVRVAATRAGNAAGLIHAVEPARAIVQRIVAEAETVMRERVRQVLH